MKIAISRELILRLAAQPAEKQAKFIKGMSVEELLGLDGAFEAWGQDGQHPPSEEGWRVWLMLAGRGFGKTRAGAEWVHALAGARRTIRIALVGATIAEARSVMVEGPSGLIAIARRYKARLKWEPSINRLSWPGGAQAQIFSGDNANGLRGPEHHFAWCAPGTRPDGRGLRRGASALEPSDHTGARELLHRRRGADRRLGRAERSTRRIYLGRLALHRAVRRAWRAGPFERTDRDLSRDRMGNRNPARSKGRDRRPANYRSARDSDCRPRFGKRHRQRSTNRDLVNSFNAPGSWTNLYLIS